MPLNVGSISLSFGCLQGLTAKSLSLKKKLDLDFLAKFLAMPELLKTLAALENGLNAKKEGKKMSYI